MVWSYENTKKTLLAFWDLSEDIAVYAVPESFQILSKIS